MLVVTSLAAAGWLLTAAPHLQQVARKREAQALAARPGVLRLDIGADWLATVGPAEVPAPAPEVFSAQAHAHVGEDVWALEHFFWGAARPRGTVLESGANDGDVASVSWAFEHVLGWRAVLIEAGPNRYEALVTARPRALCMHAALCAEPSRLHYLQPPPGTGASDLVAGIAEFMAPSFRARWWPHTDFSSPAALDADPNSTPIACLPLATILTRVGIVHVDLWVLDTEGAELSVLQSVDWSRFSADVICVELDGHNAARDEQVVDLITSNGYALYWAGHEIGPGNNHWFIRREARGLAHKPGLIVPPGFELVYSQQ